MRTCIEHQNIEAELADIQKELDGIAADMGVLEMRKQGLKAEEARLKKCLVVRKPTPEQSATAPKRGRKKKRVEALANSVPNQPLRAPEFQCHEEGCGKLFAVPDTKKVKGETIETCPECGGTNIEAVKD